MRIIDIETGQEVVDPDVTVGYITAPTMWASPEAYATIDNVTKFALDDSDYEEVMLYRVWTAEEIARREESERQQEQQEVMDALPDAMADLSLMVSDNVTDIADIMDAIADLSEIVSGLMEGA